MTREEDRHRLVTDLLVAHAAATLFLVLREEEHREQVAAIARVSTPLRDQSVDDAVELRACFTCATDDRNRQPLQPLAKRQHCRPERIENGAQGFADVSGLRVDIGVEQRPPDDSKSQAHHVVRNVERLAVPPPTLHTVGVLRHR